MHLDRGRQLIIGVNFQSPEKWILVGLSLLLARTVVVPIPSEFTSEQISSFTPNLDFVISDSSPERFVRKMTNESSIGRVVFQSLDFSVLETENQTMIELPSSAVGVIHTSGSTANPKGVVIGEMGLSKVVDSMLERLIGLGPIRYASILPFSLLLEQVLGILLPVLTDGSVSTLPKKTPCYTGTQGNLMPYIETIRESSANFVMVPPSFLSDLQKICDRKGVRPQLFLGDVPPAIATGGAPIDISTLEYFRENQIEIFQGYGLSENTSVVAWNYPGPNVLGSVGKPLKHNQVRISPDQRIQVSGESLFLGYVSNASFKPREDDWLDTGDNGYFDEAGNLYVVGRDTNLIVLSSGRNVAPEWVENKFRSIDGLKDLLVVGHGKPFLSALLFTEVGADQGSVLRLAHERAVNIASDFPEFAQIRAFSAVPFREDYYSVSGRILRAKALERCAAYIGEIYQTESLKGHLCQTT
jgi:long-subunit acyl-CoA synthetase (AMP-forming)